MHIRETVRRAFASFLALPTGVIALFAILAATTYTLDKSGLRVVASFHDFMQGRVFGNEEATSALLATVAAGVITITARETKQQQVCGPKRIGAVGVFLPPLTG